MTKTDQATPEVIRNGRALLGFMEEDEALQFLQGMCFWDTDKEQNELRDLWRTCRDGVKRLEGNYEEPRLVDLPDKATPHLDTVQKAPMFQQAFAGRDIEFKGVELRSLVAFQKFVDVDFCDQLGWASKGMESAATLKACIPERFPLETLLHVNPQERSITFISRQLNPTIIGLAVAKGDDGNPVAQFTLGSNANYLQAVQYRGRVLLKNGYHRAYAMLAAGVTYAPCILMEGRGLLDTGAAREGFFGEHLLYSGRPPLVRDFLNDAVAQDIRLRGVKKVVRIRVDETVLPA